MPLEETDEKKLEAIKRIKHNCLLCIARKELDPRERERRAVINELNALRNEYYGLYDELRGQNKPAEEISLALDNKRVCMDALDICRKCTKDYERVSRFISGY